MGGALWSPGDASCRPGGGGGMAVLAPVPKNVSEANNKHFKEILFDTFVLKEAVKAQSIIAKECKDDTC